MAVAFDSRGAKVGGTRLQLAQPTTEYAPSRVMNDPRVGLGNFMAAPRLAGYGTPPISDVRPAKMAYDRSVQTGKDNLYKVWTTGSDSGWAYQFNALKHPPYAGWQPTYGPSRSLAPADLSLRDFPLPDPLTGKMNNEYKGAPGLIERLYLHKHDVPTYGVQQLFRGQANNVIPSSY